MLFSDVIGGVGGLLLAIPAAKDQFYRFKRVDEERRKRNSPAPKLRQVLSDAWEARRNDYDGLDSAMTAAGAIGILIAFGLKLFEA